MKIKINSVGAVFAVILMALISLTPTLVAQTAQEVTSPVVSYRYEEMKMEVNVSGGQQKQNSNIIAKMLVFGNYSLLEKLPVPVLGPTGTHIDSVSVRDLLVTSTGQIHMLVGTFKPKIMTLDGKTWKTTLDNIYGWGLQNNGSAGGFAFSEDGNFFLPGMLIYPNGDTKTESRTGVYKISPGGEYLRLFSEGLQTMDVCFSNNMVYLIEDAQRSAKVTVLDSKTGALKKVVLLPAADHRAIAVAKDGSMFIADWSGLIRHIKVNGEEIAQTIVKADRYDRKSLHAINLTDIDLSPDGQYLAIGSADGYVGVLSTDLKFVHLRRLGPIGFNTFVAWPPSDNEGK